METATSTRSPHLRCTCVKSMKGHIKPWGPTRPRDRTSSRRRSSWTPRSLMGRALRSMWLATRSTSLGTITPISATGRRHERVVGTPPLQRHRKHARLAHHELPCPHAQRTTRRCQARTRLPRHGLGVQYYDNGLCSVRSCETRATPLDAPFGWPGPLTELRPSPLADGNDEAVASQR